MFSIFKWDEPIKLPPQKKPVPPKKPVNDFYEENRAVLP
jgi:hypothetical protein